MSTTAVAFDAVRKQNRFLDYEVVFVPEHLRQSLAGVSVDWLASSDFALGHLFPPARRVWIKLEECGALLHAYYYSEDRCPVGKRIMLHGPVDIDMAEARELLRNRKAARLDVLRMPTTDLAGQSGGKEKPVISLYGEDVMVAMPGTKQELLASLGSNKRQQLGKYTRRLEREWPASVEWVCLSKEEITEELFGAVVQFNSLRLSEKGKRTLWHEAMTQQRCQLARRTGLLCGIRLNGKFVSGAVSYLYGRDAYYALIGHDPEYDYWNLGNLTTWLTMEKCLDRGARRFHFLWGVSEYKLRFGGEIKALYTISVYRNYPARVISSWIDFAPACKDAILRFARKAHMSLRNSKFGRRIFTWLRRAPSGRQNPDGN